MDADAVETHPVPGRQNLRGSYRGGPGRHGREIPGPSHRLYLMLNKPRGVLCATQDAHHPTVIDLLHHPFKQELHIVGRLDFNSTGLVLLTNDGRWSRQLSLPSSRLIKRYRVSTEQRITREQIDAFEQGMYLAYEGITTLPARLRLLGDRQALVELDFLPA